MITMARSLRILYPDAFYHITARGNEKKAVFRNTKDRERFRSYLESAAERYAAVIHTYCLLDNHYHLFLQTPAANLPQIMRHINGAYTTFFNKKHDRSGHLFQGRYKAILVEADEYAMELSRYIHLNPVRAGLVDSPAQYRWSSYAAYVGDEKPPGWLTTDFLWGFFGKSPSESKRRYRLFVNSLVGNEYSNPLRNVIGSSMLGKPDFVKEITRRFVSERKPDRDLPALRQLALKPSLEEILESVIAVSGERNALARGIGLYLCHRYSGQSLKEIGKHHDLTESGVSQANRRLSLRLKRDRKLQRLVRKAEKKLALSRV
jgi:putative transposase